MFTNKFWVLILKEPQLLLTIFLLIFMTFASPYFLSIDNLLLVLRQASIVGIVTCGISWMMISGSFDLSVGALMSFISVTLVSMLEKGYDVTYTIIVGIFIGITAGLFNGILVGKFKANPFLVTLGTMTIFQGLAFFSTGGLYYRVPRNSTYFFIGDGFLGPLAVPSIIFLCIALIMHLIFVLTPFGVRVYALGENEIAAKLSGIKVEKYRIIIYVVTGLIAAIAAMILSSRAGAGSHYLGLNYEFYAITAAVLGGNYIFGGTGSIARGVWGAMLLALLRNSLTLLGMEPPTQLIVEGIVTVSLVAVQVYGKQK